MSDSRYAAAFARLAAAREGAFVPFTVLGDPDPETSLAVLESFAAGGADMLELGIAFSDPVADGPTIQAADLRALAAGVTPPVALEVLAEFRRRHPELPLGLLLYANLVQRPGPQAFSRRLAAAGADSVLIADLPPEEAAPFARAAKTAGIGLVSMVTPLTRPARLAAIAARGGPYLYVVSRAGVTGRDASLATTAAPLLARLRAVTAIPTLLGFGIGKPAQVRAALAAGATGAISGSAAVEIIARHAPAGRPGPRARRALLAELADFTAAMKAATRRGGA
ncbi:tryptophan synthase subunit alpha [bacterium]|nr:tryptophan synthase subunit alpha [bacterium]